jgi:hypothetical protein
MTLTEPMAEVRVYGWQHDRTLDRVKWCEDHIGQYGGGWFYVWDPGEGEWSNWYFSDATYATMFALRFA